MTALRSAERLVAMLRDRARGLVTPIASLETELAVLADQIAQLRVPVKVLPFPVRGETDETLVGFPEASGVAEEEE